MSENEFQNRKRKNVLLTVKVVAILALTLLAVIFINTGKKAGGKGGAPGGKGRFGGGAGGGANGTVTSVKTVLAEKTLLHDYILTNGDVETQSSIEVFPSIGGKVVQTLVSLGSSVKTGDVIAYIDPSEPGSYYAKSPVTAPISGSIIQTPLKAGQTVTTSSVITKIGDIANLQITAYVPERYIGDIRLGLKAEVTFEAYEGVVFNASVVRISPVVDAATRTKEIVLHFDKADSRLNAGMFAKVKLYTVEYKDQIAIQQDALVNQNDKYFLYVRSDGETVQKREVSLGKNVGGYFQILSGVSEGERVVVEGMLTLADGGKIRDITDGLQKVSEEKNPSDVEEKKSGGKPEGRNPDGRKPFDGEKR